MKSFLKSLWQQLLFLKIWLKFQITKKIPSFLGLKFVNKNNLKLEFGCGPKLTPGFVGVDIRPFSGVEYLCDAWKADKFISESSVDEIYSRHFFEHMTFEQGSLILRTWRKLLRPGGKLKIIVPDIEYHIDQFRSLSWKDSAEFNPKFTTIEHALAGFWGWQREGETKFWDVHKSGYSFNLLESVLVKHGFVNILRLEDKPWNLTVECHKGTSKVKYGDKKQGPAAILAND